MKQYLVETLQLLHWAFCCPSRLQARMNTWAPMPIKAGHQPDTAASDILLGRANGRFVTQFLLLAAGLTCPLALLILRQGSWQDGWLPLVALLSAYGMGFWALAPGLSLPLFLLLAYLVRPTLFVQAITLALNTLPPYPQLLLGLGNGTGALTVVILVGYSLLRAKRLIMARFILMVGCSLAAGWGGWLATQDWLLPLLVGSSTLGFLWNFSTEINTHNDVGVVMQVVVRVVVVVAGVVVGVVAWIVAVHMAGDIAGVVVGIVAWIVASGVAGVVAGVVVGVVAGGVAGGVARHVTWIVVWIVLVVVAWIVAGGMAVVVVGVVAGGVAALATAQPLFFLVTAWLVGVLFSPLRMAESGVLVGVGMAVFGFTEQGVDAFWAIPVAWLGYYRLLPFQLGWAVLGYGTQLVPWRNRVVASVALLHWFPPYQDELLRLPLPGHAALLAAAMRQAPDNALAVWQWLQASPRLCFHYTAQSALPEIVADQVGAVTTTAELVQVVTTDHPYLPIMLPAFYSELSYNGVPSAVGQPEIAAILPPLQGLARDVAAALTTENLALRERGLERVLNQLRLLRRQLPGKGINQAGIARWQPAFGRWEDLLELELAHQRSLGQGELLNPFQVGNPLRPNRADLFKGRNGLAEQIVRLVLDRSRPTLALHGPRRMGKSSFLLNLPRLLPSSILPVYLDIQDGATTNSEGDFWYSLVRAMRNDCRSQGLELPVPDRATFKSDPYPALQDWLDVALLLLGDRRLLLNLDEFEKLGEAIRAGRLSMRLFDQLRHLIQHNETLGFLFAGMQTLEELGPNWSSYFISVEQLNLLYLQPAEAAQLLTAPDPAFKLQYAPGLIDEIITLTRGHPYLLQLIGSNLVKQANAHQTQTATPPLLAVALQNAFTEAPAYFTEVWKLYREFTGQPPAEVIAGRRLLLAVATGQSLAIDDDAITQRALHRLIRYHILEQVSDNYQVEIPLVARWVRERARLDAEA